LGLGRGDQLEVFLHQRQNPDRRIVLKDQLALGGHLLQLLEHHVGAIPHLLDLVPLRRIGYRHPEHGLIGFDAVEWQAQIVATYG